MDGRGMLECLGGACRDAREAKGVRQIDVATAAGTSHASISRFENGHSWPRLPLDGLVGAYASETGTAVPAIWKDAIARMLDP